MSGFQLFGPKFGADQLTAEEQATADAQSSLSVGVSTNTAAVTAAVKDVCLVEANTGSNEVKPR